MLRGKDNDQEPGHAGEAKDAGITTVGDDAGGVSQFGNLSELEKFPRNAATKQMMVAAMTTLNQMTQVMTRKTRMSRPKQTMGADQQMTQHKRKKR